MIYSFSNFFFPFSLLHTTGGSVLYSRSLLVIQFNYSSVYRSVPNSLTVPSSHFSLLITMSSFSNSVSLFLKINLLNLSFSNQQKTLNIRNELQVSTKFGAAPVKHPCKVMMSRTWLRKMKGCVYQGFSRS